MIHRDVTVNRPAGTKIQARNGRRYVYHVRSRKYHKEGRYYTDDRVDIGVMVYDDGNSKGNTMYPNDRYWEFYPDENKTYQEAQMFSNTLKVGGTMIVQKVLRDLQMDEVLNNIYEKDSAMVQNLITYMILFETSTFQHYPAMMRNHPVVSGVLTADTHIAEFLKDEEQEERIKLFLAAWNQMHRKNVTAYIGYDSTNINNQSKGIEMAEYGHPKIDIGAPQINLSYAMDMVDSTPLFFELYPGSIIDNSQCKYMVDKAKDYGYEKCGFVLDRGYFSEKNIKYMDDHGYALVIMLKENYQCVKEAVKVSQKQIHEFKYKYYLADHDVYGMTVKGKLYAKDKHTRYFHVFYDNSRAASLQNSIMKAYTEQEKKLQRLIDQKTVRKEDAEVYEKAFSLHYDSAGYLESFKRKEKYLQRMMEEAGYFVICTSENMTAEEALNIYRNRDQSEKLFRVLKTELDYDKTAVYSDASVRTKTQLAFLATIVRNRIFQKLKLVVKETGDRKNYTVNAALHSAENIEITKNTHDAYVRDYGLTKVQKNIFKAFDMSDADVDHLASRISKLAAR